MGLEVNSSILSLETRLQELQVKKQQKVAQSQIESAAPASAQSSGGSLRSVFGANEPPSINKTTASSRIFVDAVSICAEMKALKDQLETQRAVQKQMEEQRNNPRFEGQNFEPGFGNKNPEPRFEGQKLKSSFGVGLSISG